MAYRKATSITISERVREILEQMARQSTTEYSLVMRARLVLAMAARNSNRRIAQMHHLDRDTVRRWRERWLQEQPRIEETEATPASPTELREVIRATLSDAERSGAPSVFTPEQMVAIMAVACEPPAASGRPISHWTPAELAAEAVKRQIVESISPSTIGRFLKSGRPQTARD